jgi:muramidase (phage lysozyme)
MLTRNLQDVQIKQQIMCCGMATALWRLSPCWRGGFVSAVWPRRGLKWHPLASVFHLVTVCCPLMPRISPKLWLSSSDTKCQDELFVKQLAQVLFCELRSKASQQVSTKIMCQVLHWLSRVAQSLKAKTCEARQHETCSWVAVCKVVTQILLLRASWAKQAWS